MICNKRWFSQIVLVAVSVLPSIASADDVGPGDVPAMNNDQAANLLVVDLGNPLLLTVGSYYASQFNYEFGSQQAISGDITPIVLTGDGVSNFTPIALGNTITAINNTPFQSVTFGGSDVFTLGSAATVYGGLYWSAGGGSMPVGFLNGSGSSYIRYAGADAPSVGVPISGGDESGNPFARAYDFSITIYTIPEPASVSLLFAAALVAGATQRRWRA